MKLLIVDDEEFTRECISSQIDWKSYGIEVVGTAINGGDALNKIHALTPDFVIADIKMPQMSGLDLLEEIQREGLDVETIMLSGFEEFEFAQKALNLGAKYFFLKPVDPAELLNAVITLQDKRIARKQPENKESLETYLRNVLYMAYTPEKQDEENEKYVAIRDNWQAIILLQMDNISEALYIGENSAYKLAISNIETYSYTFGACYLLEKSPNNIMIYVLAPTKDEVRQNLDNILLLLQKAMQQASYQDYVVGVSGINYSLDESGKSYLEASRAANMKFVYGSNRLYYAEDEGMLHRKGRLSSNELVKEIIENTVYYNEKEADALIGRLFEGARERNAETDVLQQAVYMIVTGLVRHEALINIDINSLYANPQSIIMSLCTCEDAQEMERKLKSVLHTIGRQLNKVKIKKPNQTITKIQHYIEEHYRQKDLSLSRIAEEFNFSAAYLSALFKANCNQNITDYINSVRIEEACRMLKQEKYTVSCIAETVGYANTTYFYKVFKKMKGCAPKDYLEGQ